MASVFGLPFAVGFIVVSMCFVVRLIIAMCDETETSRSQPPSRRQESSGSRAASEDQQPSPQLVIPIANPTRPYTYEEMKAATNGFSDANLLGQGGFGLVYKGALEGMDVAIKKLKPGSSQGDREFRAEIDIISRVHHKNLASLVGFCSDGDQRLLAYEFVPNNTLEFHLHGSDQPTFLSWSRRWTIALTSAKGLAYLHDDCQPKIIHRDIKAANILLDMNFEAKVADFGLARFQPAPITHVSTRVMGTFGYLAPEYATTGRLTSKSDVFSFGVVLLELITGREPIQSPQSNVNAILIDWARPLLKRACEENIYNGLVDPRLQNKFDRDQMTRLIKCAAEAVSHSADDRPTMSQIYHCLEGGNAVEDPKSGATPGQSSSNVSGQGRNRNTF